MPRLVYRFPLLTIFSVSLFAQNVVGTWQGIVHPPTTDTDQRTVIKILSMDGDPIKGNFYSIQQSTRAYPLTLTVQNSVVKMNIPGIGAVYEAKLSADGNTMDGTIKEGFPFPVKWILKRVGEKEAWELPPPPSAPKPLTTADPVFEVATIKLTPGDVRGRGMRLQGSSFSTVNLPLLDMLTFAYDIHRQQVIGMPAWASTEGYSVTAKVEGEGFPTQDQVRVMLRKLIMERFQIKLHRDQQELSVYTLNVAKGGLKLSKTEDVKAPPQTIYTGPGRLSFNNIAITDFARAIQGSALDRPLVNQTGLTGGYDFTLTWTPDQLLNAAPNPNVVAPPPDIFGAVQQQLGLKLDATKLKIEVFVIDQVEKPTEN